MPFVKQPNFSKLSIHGIAKNKRKHHRKSKLQIIEIYSVSQDFYYFTNQNH